MLDDEERDEKVAPHAGAWIEISNSSDIGEKRDVAPHAGAWIEMTTRRRSSP